MSQQDLANFLRKRAEALGMSVTAVAEESGIARQTYHRLLSQETNRAKLKTLTRIFKTLRTPIEQGLDYYYLSAKHRRRPSFLRRGNMNHPLEPKICIPS